jgi:hypothetical protein
MPIGSVKAMRCKLVMRSGGRRNIEMLGNRAIFGLRRGKVVFLYDLLDLKRAEITTCGSSGRLPHCAT